MLREKIHQFYLKEFQEHFVLVPADKAVDVVTREFCNVDSTGPRTYNEKCGKLVEEHLDYMAANNIRVPSDMAQLPQLYWLTNSQ